MGRPQIEVKQPNIDFYAGSSSRHWYAYVSSTAGAIRGPLYRKNAITLDKRYQFIKKKRRNIGYWSRT
jgi:hypothetical protein